MTGWSTRRCSGCSGVVSVRFGGGGDSVIYRGFSVIYRWVSVILPAMKPGGLSVATA